MLEQNFSLLFQISFPDYDFRANGKYQIMKSDYEDEIRVIDLDMNCHQPRRGALVFTMFQCTSSSENADFQSGDEVP